jgi:hypothetical protein
LGSLAHEVSPTYELIKDTRNAIRLLGSRIANGLEYLYKVGFSIMESLSREQRIEAEHERAVRKYLKNIKAVTDLMVMITIETEEPESHSFTKALVRYMSLAKSAQAEFEVHFASQTEPLQQPVQGPHEQDGTPPSPSNTFYFPSNDIHGNPNDERGVDETYSEAMDRYSSQLNDEAVDSHDDIPEHTNADVGTRLKDPPEQVYPSLMMKAECVPVQHIPETEEQLVVVATMASQGQIIIAEPVGEGHESDEEEEQIEVAKALSLSEYQADERKPAAADLPHQQVVTTEITPVKETTELSEQQVEQLGADSAQAYNANMSNSISEAIHNPLAETDSEDGSKSVSIYCRASNMRDVSNLTFPTGVGHNSDESDSYESATVTELSPRRTR